jgi:hypothetical protein
MGWAKYGATLGLNTGPVPIFCWASPMVMALSQEVHLDADFLNRE